MVVSRLYPKARSRKTALADYITRYQELRDRSSADVAFTAGIRLRRTNALLQTVFEYTSDGILIIDEEGHVQVANEAGAALLGCSLANLVGRPFRELIPESASVIGESLRSSRLPSPYRESVARHADGSEVHLEFGVSGFLFGDEMVGVVMIRDISDRWHQQRQLEHQALHDALTGLPNRVLLMDRLEMALVASKRQQKPLALLMLDLDRFKEVNDTLGHFAGDALLREVAQRLLTVQRSTDTIARLGGDEFAVLAPGASHLDDVIAVARRMAETIRKPFPFNGLVIEVDVSIGIALAPEHAEEKNRLLQCADVAMYTAKAENKDISIYNLNKDHNSVRHLTVTGQLRRAIEDRQILLVYQPQLTLATLETTSTEALARWTHPIHGPISPMEFILHAERTGLIHDLTLLILETAVGQVAEWRRMGLNVGVAVNISAKALHDSAFPRVIADTLSRFGVEPASMILEITESAIMCDPTKALIVARTIAEMGISLSIDDFGTGYSSLSYLSNLPASELKIDKSFVLRMMQKSQDLAIVQSTIDLAHNLGLTVVAEGVENLDVLQRLSSLSCEKVQGHYVCHPTEPAALTDWLKRPLSNDLVALVTRKHIAG